jgi:hypothetical protein
MVFYQNISTCILGTLCDLTKAKMLSGTDMVVDVYIRGCHCTPQSGYWLWEHRLQISCQCPGIQDLDLRSKQLVDEHGCWQN